METEAEKKYDILLIEDDGYISELYARKFESDSFDVRLAGDGVEAWDILSKGDLHPDAILLDLNMPHMDGMEFLKKIRADIRWNDVCVIVLTNMPADEQARAVFSLGAQEYIEKAKYTPSEIFEKVKKTLDNRSE